MNLINLNKTDEYEFAKKIKTIKIENIMYFSLTSAIAKNIQIFIYYLNEKKVNKIIIYKQKEPLDIICYRIFQLYFEKNYLLLTKDVNVIFENFSHKELYHLLNERFYLNYCFNNNIEPKWNLKELTEEKKKINENKYLFKYNTFKTLVEFQKELPFSRFNIPTQSNLDRFVFYFQMYSEPQKDKILNLMKKLNLQGYKEIIQLIKTNKINEEIFYYALGFVYNDNKLKRLTLYTKFTNSFVLKDKVKDFLLKKHNIKLYNNYKNIWQYGFDIYDDNSCEVKLYDEPYIFEKEIEDKEIHNLFFKKSCVKATKYKNIQIIDTKYEFEFKKVFNLNEIEKLKKLNLYKENNKIIAIYIKNKKIVNKVFYQL